MSDFELGVLGLITCGVLLVGYMLPTIVAFVRRHPQKWPIMMANIVLGWTIFVWGGLLAYALWSYVLEQERLYR